MILPTIAAIIANVLDLKRLKRLGAMLRRLKMADSETISARAAQVMG